MESYSDTAIAQFENENSLRNYPFASGASLMDSMGRTLPENVIVDLHVAVPYGIPDSASGFDDAVAIPSVRLSSVHLSRHMVSVCFKSGEGKYARALSVTVSSDEFRPYMPYSLDRLIGDEDIGGIVTFGDIALPEWPDTYSLDAEVHPGCVVASRPSGLRSVLDRRSGDSVRGDVSLSFSGYVSAKKIGESFGLSLEDGAAEELASECSGMTQLEACGATPIRSINGVSPDEDGNIVLWFH